VRRDIVRALRLIGEAEAATRRDGGLSLRSPQAGDPAGAVELDAGTVGRMVSEGLVARLGGMVRRTAAGRAYLRRALSGGENAYEMQHRIPVTRAFTTAVGATVALTNAAESPLAWLATRRDKMGDPFVSAEQRAAGERLHRDYARGHMPDPVGQSWDATGVRGEAPRDRLSVSEGSLDARRRVERALAAVGPGLADALVGVCCEELGLEAVEKRHRWPPRSGKIVLRLALDRLAAHYGMAPVARGADWAPTVHWGADGYRPRS
jgi:hypothetical protein